MLYHPCGFVSFFSNDVKFHATFVYAGRPRHVPSLAVMYAFCRGRSTIESEFSPFSAMPVARATWPPQLLHTTSVTNIVWCDVMANVDGLTLPMPSAMTGLPGVRTCSRPNVTPLTVLGVGSPGAGGRSEVALYVGELRVADADVGCGATVDDAGVVGAAVLDVGADVEVGALEDAAVDVVRCDDVDVAEGVDAEVDAEVDAVAVNDDVPDAGFEPSSDEQPVRAARPAMNVTLTIPRVLMLQR